MSVKSKEQCRERHEQKARNRQQREEQEQEQEQEQKQQEEPQEQMADGPSLVEGDGDGSGDDLIHYEIQPTIFWYDSNHLCHVQRYLEIYTPFRAMPSALKILLQEKDPNLIQRLVLRRGDFIEDRFGQVQRNLLVSLKQDPVLLLRTHQWFGSYLLYSHRLIAEEEPGEERLAAKERGGEGDGDGDSSGGDEDVLSDGQANVMSEGDDALTDRWKQDKERAEGLLSLNKARYESNPYSQIPSRVMVSHLRGRQYRVTVPVPVPVPIEKSDS
jgi:hypothetical protein